MGAAGDETFYAWLAEPAFGLQSPPHTTSTSSNDDDGGSRGGTGVVEARRRAAAGGCGSAGSGARARPSPAHAPPRPADLCFRSCLPPTPHFLPRVPLQRSTLLRTCPFASVHSLSDASRPPNGELSGASPFPPAPVFFFRGDGGRGGFGATMNPNSTRNDGPPSGRSSNIELFNTERQLVDPPAPAAALAAARRLQRPPEGEGRKETGPGSDDYAEA
jgi:hypothetical protein